MVKKKIEKAKNKKIQRFTLTNENIEKWLMNAALFLAPAVLMFLMSVQAGNSVNDSLKLIQLWALNTAIDLLKKFIAGNTK